MTFAFCVVLAGALVSTPMAAATVHAQDACQFVFGFATMRDMLGPQVVGNCVEDERFVAGNGNAEQRTTRGLLVYSALDNYMRFITDNRTWINTGDRVFDRPNNQRFEWEGDRQLVEDLQGGGYIIYFRHGATDSSQTDSVPPNLDNCSAQRNLTDRGRDQAANIGLGLRALQIPVERVISSPYCRAREYSYLMLGRAEFEPSIALPDPLPEAEARANTETFRRLLSTLTPPAGSNVVIVAHSPNIRDAAGVDLPVEGEAAILSPTPDGAPTLVARILPDDWATLAAALAPR
jgi:phosphohistidine phosphatase SixA